MPLPDPSYRRAQLPLSMGGLGAGICRATAPRRLYWSSWANTVRALREHQPGVLAALLRPLLDTTASGTFPSTRAAEQAARFLRSEGFSTPTWARLLEEDAAAPAPHPNRPAPGGKTVSCATRGIESTVTSSALETMGQRHRPQRLGRCCGSQCWRCRDAAQLHGPPNERRHPGAGRRVPSHGPPHSADSVCSSLSPRSAAPVEDAWMFTATIARPAPRWACWPAELAPLSARQHASARRREPEWHRTSPSAILTG